MFISLPGIHFQKISGNIFRIGNKVSLVRAQTQLDKKMLTLSVTNRIIMKITV
jgi:hypothetical protein